MNIFVLDLNPKIAAQYHCDKHVIKMITEYSQLLSTWAHNHPHLSPVPSSNILFKQTHVHHPCNKWLNESLENVRWLHNLLGCLINEYCFRYGKLNKFVRSRLLHDKFFIVQPSYRIVTPFALAMPDQYKIQNDAVQSYRLYYKNEKQHILKYTKREKPIWLT